MTYFKTIKLKYSDKWIHKSKVSMVLKVTNIPNGQLMNRILFYWEKTAGYIKHGFSWNKTSFFLQTWKMQILLEMQFSYIISRGADHTFLKSNVECKSNIVAGSLIDDALKIIKTLKWKYQHLKNSISQYKQKSSSNQSLKRICKHRRL